LGAADDLLNEYVQETRNKNKDLEKRCIDLEEILKQKDLEIQRLKTKIKKPSRKESTGRRRNININDTAVIKLRNQKKSVREIAKETSLSPTTVQKILKNVKY
jgi:DNA invertase Pin-like site-specific DNA recombinase